MNFQPDESQLNALKTWYPIDSPLHLDPRHAVIKLAGEAGEILDLYGKHEYKPNFSWWNCKHCGENEEWHSKNNGWCYPWNVIGKENTVFTCRILDELGDYSYYLRILAYQKEVSFLYLCNEYRPSDFTIEDYLDDLNYHSAKLFRTWKTFGEIKEDRLRTLCNTFISILFTLDTTLEQVLVLNYKKLNSEPTNHGWNNA